MKLFQAFYNSTYPEDQRSEGIFIDEQSAENAVAVLNEASEHQEWIVRPLEAISGENLQFKPVWYVAVTRTPLTKGIGFLMEEHRHASLTVDLPDVLIEPTYDEGITSPRGGLAVFYSHDLTELRSRADALVKKWVAEYEVRGRGN